MIKKVGKKYRLYTKDGSRALGPATTKAKALKQERAIQAAKHARGGIERVKFATDGLKRLRHWLRVGPGKKLLEKALQAGIAEACRTSANRISSGRQAVNN